MIAVAIVCAAALSQAATANWSAYPIYEKGKTTGADGYIGYYIDASNYSTALSILQSGDFSGLTSIGFASAGASQWGGYLTGSDAGSYGSGETVNAYLVVLNADSIDNATYAYISGVATGATGGEGQVANIDFTSAVASMKQDSAWYEAKSIPEPTSGLLLLLGVAGLALRRRRA